MKNLNYKCGYVALIGRPNVGKSTLMNALLKEGLSIVTPKAQTTRHRITGILNTRQAQVIFFDTPGYHQSQKLLNQYMNDIVASCIKDADIICLMLSADGDDLEKELFSRIGRDKCIVVVNKADKIRRDKYDKIAEHYREGWGVKELVIISALKNEGVETLVEALIEHLPAGEALFPDDIYTTHTTRFIASELIREQVFRQMHDEIPYSAAVEIESFKEATDEKPITVIHASIIVEKESQKGMVIGKAGARIRQIGKTARHSIENLVGGRVFLELNVRVEKGWTKDDLKIKKIATFEEGGR